MYRDWRMLGRPHKVYLIALPILILQAWLVVRSPRPGPGRPSPAGS